MLHEIDKQALLTQLFKSEQKFDVNTIMSAHIVTTLTWETDAWYGDDEDGIEMTPEYELQIFIWNTYLCTKNNEYHRYYRGTLEYMVTHDLEKGIDIGFDPTLSEPRYSIRDQETARSYTMLEYDSFEKNDWERKYFQPGGLELYSNYIGGPVIRDFANSLIPFIDHKYLFNELMRSTVLTIEEKTLDYQTRVEKLGSLRDKYSQHIG